MNVEPKKRIVSHVNKVYVKKVVKIYYSSLKLEINRSSYVEFTIRVPLIVLSQQRAAATTSALWKIIILWMIYSRSMKRNKDIIKTQGQREYTKHSCINRRGKKTGFFPFIINRLCILYFHFHDLILLRIYYNKIFGYF